MIVLFVFFIGKVGWMFLSFGSFAASLLVGQSFVLLHSSLSSIIFTFDLLLVVFFFSSFLSYLVG